jgi:hypothetical protein
MEATPPKKAARKRLMFEDFNQKARRVNIYNA